MRRSIVAGNWKMNTSRKDAEQLVKGLRNGKWPEGVPMVLAVPFTHIAWVSDWLAGDARFVLSAQNCYFRDSGAFTGEVSAPMLRDAGATMVILGHSERRELFGETDVMIGLKVRHALEHGCEVIFCLGEKLEEREAGAASEVVRRQLHGALSGLTSAQMKNVIIAYEPVWAIGTGVTASPEQAQEIHRFIRDEVEGLWGAETAGETSILYGGSVNPGNASVLFSQADIDGGLVGGASLKMDDFLAIANSF